MQPLLHYVCYAADGIMTSGENVSMYYRGKGLRCGGGGEYHGVQQPSPYSQKCPPQTTSVLRGHWESQPQGYEGFFAEPVASSSAAPSVRPAVDMRNSPRGNPLRLKGILIPNRRLKGILIPPPHRQKGIRMPFPHRRKGIVMSAPHQLKGIVIPPRHRLKGILIPPPALPAVLASRMHEPPPQRSEGKVNTTPAAGAVLPACFAADDAASPPLQQQQPQRPQQLSASLVAKTMENQCSCHSSRGRGGHAADSCGGPFDVGGCTGG